MEENEEDKIEENIKEEKKPTKFKGTITERMRENPWMISTFALGIFVLVLVGNFGALTGSTITGSTISEGDAGSAILNFIKTQTGGEGELIDVSEFGENLYEITVLYQGNEAPFYLTKDGEILVQGVMPLSAIQKQTPSQQQTSVDVPKSDKPVVELFVMSICPFGTQAEKGIIPVIELLRDKIDFNLRFVSYAMHGKPELDENSVQYCIQKEQSDKFLSYMKCYLEKNSVESWNACQDKVGLNKAKLNSCIKAMDKQFKITELFNDESTWSGGRYPQFNVDKSLNTKYGVGGSPTLIINGVQSNAGRDSASYLAGICAAFNEVPKECEAVLSSASPSSGFGYSGSGSNSATQCS